MVEKAYNEGVSHKDTKSQLNKYISKLWLTHPGSTAKIYGENIFFFQKNTLITLYRLPNNLIKYLQYIDTGTQ